MRKGGKFSTFILFRSEYFKTALNTDVGPKKKVREVKECHPYVLETVVNFMYDVSIPDDFNLQDFESLLYMADLYHMADLKDAIGSLTCKHWNTNNILALSHLAEKYKAEKMQEMCCDFILVNLAILDKNLLDQLFLALPLLGRKSWERLNEPRPRGIEIANKVLGINLSVMADAFNRRIEFSSEEDSFQSKVQSKVDYEQYIKGQIQQDMLVLCNKTSKWWHHLSWNSDTVKEGTIGRVVECEPFGKPIVKWETGLVMKGEHAHLDLLTPPIKTTLFS